MDDHIKKQFDSLVEKFAELLVGDNQESTVEKIKLWSIYNHIHKSMPALASHWTKEHPEAREAVKQLFEEIKSMNEAYRSSRNPQ